MLDPENKKKRISKILKIAQIICGSLIVVLLLVGIIYSVVDNSDKDNQSFAFADNSFVRSSSFYPESSLVGIYKCWNSPQNFIISGDYDVYNISLSNLAIGGHFDIFSNSTSSLTASSVSFFYYSYHVETFSIANLFYVDSDFANVFFRIIRESTSVFTLYSMTGISPSQIRLGSFTILLNRDNSHSVSFTPSEYVNEYQYPGLIFSFQLDFFETERPALYSWTHFLNSLSSLCPPASSLYDAGTASGYNSGYDAGTASGYNSGYDAGYSVGYSAGQSSVSGDVINPISFLLGPVDTFMHIKLFGDISIGLLLGILLCVAVSIIFIKFFAGG